MEKYSHFRDKATGIGPFFNNPGVTLRGLGAIDLVRYTAGSAISAVLRVPVIFMLLGVVALMPATAPPMIYNLMRPVLALLLVVAGISSKDIQVEEHKKKDTEKFLPKPGSIVITNFVSPLDPLIYQSIANSLFIIPVTSADEQFIIYQKHTLFSTLCAALSLPKLLKGSESVFASKSLQEIAAEAKLRGQVVVVFAEGTTSNGKGVLPLILRPEESQKPGANGKSSKPLLLPKFPTYPAAIKYSRSSIATPAPTSLGAWAWKLVQGFQFCTVRVRYAVPIDDENQSKGSGTSTGISTTYSSQSYTETTYKGCISEGICRVGRLKEVGLGVKAKIEYNNVQKNGPKK